MRRVIIMGLIDNSSSRKVILPLLFGAYLFLLNIYNVGTLHAAENSMIAFNNSANEQQNEPAHTGQPKIRFIDSYTGYAVYPEEVVIKEKVKKNVVYKKSLSKEEAKREFGKGVLKTAISLPPGAYEYVISPSGHRPMSAGFDFSYSSPESIEFHVDPLEAPDELKAGNLQLLKRLDLKVLVGFIVDDDSGLPLADIRVSTTDGSAVTWTNERGYFALQISALDANGSVPTKDVIFAKKGYRCNLPL